MRAPRPWSLERSAVRSVSLAISAATGGVALGFPLEPARSAEIDAWWDGAWARRSTVSVDGAESGRDVLVEVPLDDQHLDWTHGTADLRFVFQQEEQGPVVLDHWIWTDRITHGAWFACCQDSRYEQYHTPAATYYTCLRPNAIHYRGTKDRTYFVYGDVTRDPAVQFLDHETDRLSDAVLPGPTQIPGDAHGNPSLLLDDRGHVMIFYGCHGHPVQVRRSLDPESIDRWSEEGRIDVPASYPQPYMIEPGKILVSLRRTGAGQHHPWSYVTSIDYGSTWSSVRDIVGRSGYAIYGITDVWNDPSGPDLPRDDDPPSPLAQARRTDMPNEGASGSSRVFHLAFTPFQYQSALYKGVYYLRSDDGLHTFTDARGSHLGTPPLDATRAEVVYPPGTQSSHVNDLVVDSRGRPYILFNVGPWNRSGAPAPGEWRVAHVGIDGAWTTSPVTSCDHLFDRGCLRIEESGALYAYLPVGADGADGGTLTEFVSLDQGTSWFLGKRISESKATLGPSIPRAWDSPAGTANTGASRDRDGDPGREPTRVLDNYAVHVVNADPELQVIWSSGPSEPTGRNFGSVPSEVVLFGEDGIRGRLEPGRARAIVRIPDLGSRGNIYLYSHNRDAPDVANLGGTFRGSYAVDTNGTVDGSLLGEWRMEPSDPDVGDSAQLRPIALPPEGLVADASAHGNGVTLTGGAALIPGSPPLGRRLDLTRAGHVLQCATGADGALSAALAGPAELAAFSVELWASLESAVGRLPVLRVDAERRVLEVKVGSPFEVSIDNGSGVARFVFPTPTLGFRIWHHYAVTCDGEAVRAWIDGHELASAGRTSGTIPWQGARLTLGSWGSPNAPVLLDDVRIYSRALPGEEIRAHIQGRDERNLKARLEDPESIASTVVPFAITIGPNPASSDVGIAFEQTGRQVVRIGVFDPSGRRIRNLVNEELPQGRTRILWDRTTDRGLEAPTGVYFVDIVAGGRKSSTRIVVVR